MINSHVSCLVYVVVSLSFPCLSCLAADCDGDDAEDNDDSFSMSAPTRIGRLVWCLFFILLLLLELLFELCMLQWVVMKIHLHCNVKILSRPTFTDRRVRCLNQ